MSADDGCVPNQWHGYLFFAQQTLVVFGHSSPDAAHLFRRVLVHRARRKRLHIRNNNIIYNATDRSSAVYHAHACIVNSSYDFFDNVAIRVDKLHHSRPVRPVSVERKVQVFPVEREPPSSHVIQTDFLQRRGRIVHPLVVGFRCGRSAGQNCGEI